MNTVNFDRYAVLGHPVAHSRSPFIHARFAEQTGEALRYATQECPLDGFAASLQAFAEAGGAGCNVTVPFKFEALAVAASASPRALLAGAANVLKRTADGSGWWADNTDGVGLVRDIQDNAGVLLAGQRVLLVGAGGAGAGVLGPLLAARPAQVVVANRSVDKATALVARHSAWAALHGVALSASGLAGAGEGFAVVLNASASSLTGAPSPVAASVLAPRALVVDLMYGPAAAAFLAWAENADAVLGVRARDGLGMLVEQAAEAFFVWRGVRPQTPPVLAALRAQMAADAAIAATAETAPIPANLANPANPANPSNPATPAVAPRATS